MGKALRKREQKTIAPSPLDPVLMKAWHTGLNAGSAE